MHARTQRTHFTRARAQTHTHAHVRPPLPAAGYSLDKAAVRAVFARFDPSRRGALGLAEFLALTLFLRSATATFCVRR
jgi:hypothetical protein